MDVKFVEIIFVSVAVMAAICTLVIVYCMKREQRLVGSLQKMLDDAIEGKFQDTHLDESRLSSLENSMWRYLCDNQVTCKNLSEEKERIQTQISDIAHQSITPISNIVLYAQLLEEWQTTQNGFENPEVIEWMSAIRDQAEEIDFLMEAFVKLSRLEIGIIKVKPLKQPIQPLLTAVHKQLLPKAEQKEISISIADTDEMAVFDSKWTMEAVANVVDNAIKYSPFGGKVSIHVEPYSFFVRIDISDNGIGIPETEHANIFTRFYRSPAVIEQSGLGIGLYLAREVMTAQEGYIKLTSSEGAGSVFSLFLLKDEKSQK